MCNELVDGCNGIEFESDLVCVEKLYEHNCI